MSISRLIPTSSAAALLGVFSDPNRGISRRGSSLGADALTSTDDRTGYWRNREFRASWVPLSQQRRSDG